jgi:glutathione S-transferase
MSEFIVHGVPGSPYVRSALLGLHEKQTPYRFVALPAGIGATHSAEHRERHPFGRVPVLEHGDFRLYETQAILRYLDEVLPGPALQPQDSRATARMNQIVGINDWYVFPYISVGITAERLMSQVFWNRAPSEENIAKALPWARVCVQELQRLQGSAEFLAGEALSIADLMVAPQLSFFRGTPEGEELLAGTSLDEWLSRMHARAGFQATEVERLKQAA